MIIKGKARGRAEQLARHLGRADTNERVELVETRYLVAETLSGALREMEALGDAARTTKPLYHAAISPAADRPLTPAQRTLAVDTLEQRMGFAGQPRVVVVHEKEGREHIHVVWSRIDLEKGKAIHDSWNYMRHEQVARELERAFGHERVPGALAERDGRPRPGRTPTLAELRQAERAGINKVEVGAELTEIWRQSASGREFRAEIEYAGYVLAQGDRRTFVVLDPAGEVHALARRIDGVRTKDVREKLADITLEALPSVTEARDVIRLRMAELKAELDREHQFSVAALQAAQDKEKSEQEQRREEARRKGVLYTKVRQKMDSHLAATLYSAPDYVSMTQDARQHIADKVRVRDSFMRGVAIRYWEERIPKWQDQARTRELGKLRTQHRKELTPIWKTESRLNDLDAAERRRQRNDHHRHHHGGAEQQQRQTPTTTGADDAPAHRTRTQRERDDLHPTRELTESARAAVEKAIDRTLSNPAASAPRPNQRDRGREKDSDRER